MKITIIHGGTSSEQEFSTANAEAVKRALLELGHEVRMLFYGEGIFADLTAHRPDLVFLCVQGKGHGDGTLQSILDFMQIPYTGTKAQQAAIINDKVVCQALFADAGLPVAAHFSMSYSEYSSADGPSVFASRMETSGLDYPVVAKALTEGACIGINLIESPEQYSLIADSFPDKAPDTRVLIEDYLTGRTLTVSLLQVNGNWKPLTFLSGEQLLPDGNGGPGRFDHAGYLKVVGVPYGSEERIRQNAVSAARLTGAKDYCRVDFIYDEEQDMEYLLEINAVPGLRDISFFPRAALESGITFTSLIRHIIESAMPEKDSDEEKEEEV